MKNFARNKKGNVLLQVLAATAIMGSSFYFLSNYVIGQKAQVSKTINYVKLRFALNSAMDYVIYGVRQKFCFSENSLMMADMGSACNLAHSGSVERLIMSTDQENFIRQLIADGKDVGPLDPNAVDSNKIILRKIDRYIKMDGVTNVHPLFEVIDSLKRTPGAKDLGVGAIHVTLTRNDSIDMPKAGREIYIQVDVALVKATGNTKPLTVGNKELKVSSQIAIYPRELGSFALIAPGNVHLDKTWSENLPLGDITFHKFGSKAELGNSIGLVFQSPVFVNKDIHIAPDNNKGTGTSVAYSPVTFAERVYLGNGKVKTSNGIFRPSTSGEQGSRLWSDIRTYGGFLKGIENDGGLDEGLLYFANKSMNQTVDKTLMNECSNLGKKQSDLDSIAKSEMGANRIKSSNNGGTYRLQLTSWNTYNPQKSQLKLDTSAWRGTANVKGGKYSDAVLKVEVDVGGRSVIADLPLGGTLSLQAEVGSEKFFEGLEEKVSEAELAVNQEKRAEERLRDDLADNRQSLSSKQSSLQNEQNKTPKDQNAIARLENDINRIEDKISDIQRKDLPRQEEKTRDAQAKYTAANNRNKEFTALKNNPPKIEVEAKAVDGSRGKTSRDKVDLEVAVRNPASLINDKGDLKTPVIKVQAYDVSYVDGSTVAPKVNLNLVGYLKPRFIDNNSRLEFPQGITRDSQGSNIVSIGGDIIDLDDLEARCAEFRGTMSSAAFGGAGWDVSFASTARTSWNFAGSDSGEVSAADPAMDNFIMRDFVPGNVKFQVRSIVGKCTIDGSSTFVTGFFACDELEIAQRDRPLRIIGTFIVGKLRIHPSAYMAGIKWSSIYMPQATRELRAAGVLKPFSDGKSCNDQNADPIWHPIPSVASVADRMRCNAISLRGKADPFQWTAVDPDCGMLAGGVSSNTTCKRRLVRFFVIEQAREGGL